jgi:hypothetical protein
VIIACKRQRRIGFKIAVCVLPGHE